MNGAGTCSEWEKEAAEETVPVCVSTYTPDWGQSDSTK